MKNKKVFLSSIYIIWKKSQNSFSRLFSEQMLQYASKKVSPTAYSFYVFLFCTVSNSVTSWILLYPFGDEMTRMVYNILNYRWLRVLKENKLKIWDIQPQNWEISIELQGAKSCPPPPPNLSWALAQRAHEDSKAHYSVGRQRRRWLVAWRSRRS